MTAEEKIRYSRHIILSEIGEEGQMKLKQAQVLVIGAGGLGCPVLQYLAAAGVGKIGIIDGDRIEESNLQRQVLYDTKDIGKQKAQTAKEKLSEQNPNINIVAYNDMLSNANALEIISIYDIIVDGSDNFPTRYLVNDACVILNKPLVFASIFKFEAQLSVFNYQNGPTYRCLYPEPPAEGEVPNCSEIGVMGVLPGIAGTLQANEVIKIVTSIGEVLSGRLLTFNILTMEFSKLEFKANPENLDIKSLTDYEIFCGSGIKEITASELKKKLKAKENIQLIDVRESDEYEKFNIGGELIPLSVLKDNLHKFVKSKIIIVHCQSGIRSKKAVGILKENGVEAWSLKGGVGEFG